MKLLIIYIAAVNLLGFLLMGADKRKAQRKERRVPERTLLGIAALGGSVGVALGMVEFRHKTLHKKFTIGVPAIMLIQAALCVLAVTSFGK